LIIKGNEVNRQSLCCAEAQKGKTNNIYIYIYIYIFQLITPMLTGTSHLLGSRSGNFFKYEVLNYTSQLLG